MNVDEITLMARKAGFVGFDGKNKSLCKFAALVEEAARADVREACAKFFDDNDINLFWGSQVARHIRERGTT